jgi:folate-dependent phosphoribosylglycinamide formyltransferase PurN
LSFLHSSAILGVMAFVAFPGFAAEPSSPLEFPRIAGYGGVVRLPDAGERPRAGGKVVFDTTAAAAAGKPNRGLDSAARLVNIYASEGMEQSRPRIAVILHTGATLAALSDEAHGRSATGGPNPNRQLVEDLRASGAELIVLGGYMRLVKAPLLEAFPRRIVNIHPSLLPSFPGLEAWKQALAAGVEKTGCTVHFVDAGMDTGEIIAQTDVLVLPGDTAETLHARIQEAEHRLYPEVIARFARREII